MARSRGSSRLSISLVCEKCSARNYKTTRTKGVTAKPLELRKHCPTCRVHTLHKESK